MRSPAGGHKIDALRFAAASSLLASLVAVAALLGGCDARSLAPFASFETRCGRLPPARFHVVTIPMVVTEDDSEGVEQLTTRSGTSTDRQRTYGLTVANFGHETESRLRILEESSTGRTCATPEIDVTLSMHPTTVYVARELAGDRCRHEATRQHELRHVEAYRALLEEAAEKLRAELPQAVPRNALSGASAAELRTRFDATLRAFLHAFMRAQHAVLAERQALIDTPEEYARVGRVCGSP